MQAGLVLRIERNLDRAASALLALACGYASSAWLEPRLAAPLRLAETAAAAACAYLLSMRALGAVEPRRRKLPVPVFDVRDIDDFEAPELLLTERYESPETRSAEEALLLDDILAELGPDSRVVRLFDPAAMPTPGQLDARIRNRIVRDSGSPAQDASQALHEALAELRRSLG